MLPLTTHRPPSRTARSLAPVSPLTTAMMLLSLALFPAAASGQPASGGSLPAQKSAPFVVALGTKSISLPAPPGFEEATSQFPLVKENLAKTETPLNDVLAAHVPADVAADLRRGVEREMTFYTKVSVLRNLRGVDITPADFAQFVSSFQKEGTKSLKADSPLMRERAKKLERALGEIDRGVTRFDIADVEMLGEIENAPNVYSLMMILRLRVEADGKSRTVPVAGTLAAVRVKQRLIYVYAYRRFRSTADTDTLEKFTRDWTAQILAANRGN